MLYDKPLRMLKESHPRTIRKRQTSTRCFSKSRETSDVKTSIPSELISFLKMAERPNNKITAGISNHSFKDSEESCIKMIKTVLLRDPFYIMFLYSLLFYNDLKNVKRLQNHLDDAIELTIKSLNENNDSLLYSVFQIVLYLVCLVNIDGNPDDSDKFYFCPSFFPFEKNDNSEPEPPEPEPPFDPPLIMGLNFANKKPLIFGNTLLDVKRLKEDEKYIVRNWPGKSIAA